MLISKCQRLHINANTWNCFGPETSWPTNLINPDYSSTSVIMVIMSIGSIIRLRALYVLSKDMHCCCCCCWVAQSCPTLCDPTDGSPPGSPVPGILQARTLEWVAIAFSNAWKWKVKSESEVAQSYLTLSDPIDCSPPGSSVHGIFQARVLEWGAIAFSASFPLFVGSRKFKGSHFSF